MQVLCASTDLRAQVGLDASSRVLLVNTEGATAPAVYRGLVGRDAQTEALRVRTNFPLAHVIHDEPEAPRRE